MIKTSHQVTLENVMIRDGVTVGIEARFDPTEEGEETNVKLTVRMGRDEAVEWVTGPILKEIGETFLQMANEIQINKMQS